MFEKVGWLAPYYLKMVANEVTPSGGNDTRGRAIATSADFDSAFSRLLQPDRQSEFAVWREHIDKNLPVDDKAIARSLLDILSKDPAGEKEDTLFAHISQSHGSTNRRQIKDILAMLCNDGLALKDSENYRFRSGLVRLYWYEYEAS